MSQYKAYPAYKDSGVEWIGQVPEHWKIAPVKYHYDARLGKMIQPAAVSDRDIEVPYHRAQTVQWERIVESDIKEMWASPRDIEQFSVSEGDLLICEGGDVCRAAIVKQPPEKNMIFQNSIHRIRSKGEYGVGWVMRLMQHLRSSEWIDVLCNKNTIVHFTSDKLGSLECPLPPPDEQASIAAALDRETARIDALIQKKTRFIELLKEKRQALITHAVTKGLDPNVKMKDSGVEWIGQVPEHWKIAPVKYHYDARLGKMIQPAAVSDRDIEVPYHRAQTVQWERIVESDIKEMWASPRDIEQFSVSEGDLLICEGGDVCRAAIVKQPPEKNMIFQNSIHRIRSKGEYGVGWVMRLMQHLRSSEWIDVLCNKNTIVHFTSDKLGSLECPLPPPDEQASIAAALDRETARIDALIGKAEHSITLLKERRSAFITAAVTGQIDLRGEQ